MEKSVFKQYKGKNILITGGLGFIGSNLAIKLVKLGAHVTLMDAMIPDYGGNLYNVRQIRDKININFSDTRDVNSVNYLVCGKDYIFHLAGQASHVLSLSNPFHDIDINITGTAILMEACRKFNPKAKVIYVSSRSVYGPAVKLPVDENAPTNPKGIYEISNLTAEKIIKVYFHNFGIPCVLLRLTNTYGPRAQMKNSQYGVANWFIRQAIDGNTIKVFGDGQLKRDFLFIDDCVDALLMCASNNKVNGETFNVGYSKPTNFLNLIKLIIKLTGRGKWQYAPFTTERKALEPGDFYSNISKIRMSFGWYPKISLEKGLKITISYYKKHKKHYWTPDEKN